MALNNLSPAFVKIKYTVGSRVHTATIPTIPYGSVIPGSEPNVTVRTGVPRVFSTAVTDWVTLAKVFFAATGTFDTAEFWSKPNPTDDPVWIYTHSIGVAGTSAGGTYTSSQMAMTFRTAAGGLYRAYLMETAVAVNSNWTYALLPADQKAFADYLMGNTSWIYGRDNAFLVACLFSRTKTNDALRRQLFW